MVNEISVKLSGEDLARGLNEIPRVGASYNGQKVIAIICGAYESRIDLENKLFVVQTRKGLGHLFGSENYRSTLESIEIFTRSLECDLKPVWADFNEAGLNDRDYNPYEFKRV